MENENEDYINLKLKSFLNSDFAERMDCPKIKNETFIFSQSYGATPAPNNITIMHFVL